MLNKKIKITLSFSIICFFIISSLAPTSYGFSLINKSNRYSALGNGNTLYVGGSGPNNYTAIWKALLDASDGDTIFVYDDSSPYSESIDIDKSINLIGENKDTTIIDGRGVEDVIEISADGVSVSGFTLQNARKTWQNAGIDIRANNAIIFDNNIKDCGDGINAYENRVNNVIRDNTISSTSINGIGLWYSSNNNLILNNTLHSNKGDGIEVFFCENNNIIGNYIYSSNTGIYLARSNYTTVYDNVLESNIRTGILLSGNSNYIDKNIFINDGLYVSVSITETNFFTNNTVNGKPLLCLDHESDKVIDFEVGQIVLIYCNNIIIKNQEITHTSNAIQLEGCNDCIIQDCILSENMYGVRLCPGNDNTVIVGNTISNNDYGIYGYTSGSEIEGNIVSDNSHGIYLYVGWENNILGNKISNNNYGLKLEYSALNDISNNNFIDNNRHVGFYVSSTYRNNSWDNNYWGRARIFPKLIFGKMRLGNSMINIPWFNFDNNPAKEPFDIDI